MDPLNPSMESLQPETEAIHILKKRKHDLTNDLQTARRLWRAHGSFDLKFWAQAVKIEKINLERSDVDRKVSLGSFDGVEETWKRTDEAKTILEQIEAQKQTKKICEERVHQLQSAPPRRSMRACFMKFFTTSTMGMAIKGTGAGARDTSQQSNFRAAMIETYKAKHPTEPWLWCPILGDYTDDDDIQASHLFPCRNGQDCLDAIFGKTRAEELFRHAMKNVLVSAVKGWLNCEPRQYRVKLIDPDWEKKDERSRDGKVSQLDGRPLRFRSNFRPAARYLYFHYCIQILRMCWQHSSQGRSSQAAALLQLEKGNPFWGTVGRYLPRNMLLALVEEMGHEYTFVLDGAAASRPADDKLLLGLASRHVKERPSILTPGVYDPADSEEEFSWLEEDSEDE
ncbi:hypothetical protein PDIDSM_5159 [Penicillium digitatum]|nr:hypothetical protein PDIDSM_5159 [Penicillium digitatum]